MYDSITNIDNSEIQYGSENNRIYLMHLAKEDMPDILIKLDLMADKHGYTKIIAKVPKSVSEDFIKDGYAKEAEVLGYFKGKEDCLFMAKYMDKKRQSEVDKELNKKVLDIAESKEIFDINKYHFSEEFSFRKANLSDVNKMAELYSKVFDSYPFPITEPEYIIETMKTNVIYYGIFRGNKLLALSSCEMSLKDENVEMTDFAVLPEYRGYNFANFLLSNMEKEMKKINIKTAYTIARSASYGMTITFAKGGYTYAGRLKSNTQIGGKIEDMSVWFKAL
ncbi:putative beta-lysine N-acetyltransferase [Anaerovorax odorimutans]|uniref:putative beta-lysine N-acetyltransferase n=1 Tax=Anaerovorax odorimutans TaxID=109327 RepID=UPI00041EA220|nr:putative beta-lysine N-acetyltransferase [Anaerovorax odorimutans]